MWEEKFLSVPRQNLCCIEGTYSHGIRSLGLRSKALGNEAWVAGSTVAKGRTKPHFTSWGEFKWKNLLRRAEGNYWVLDRGGVMPDVMVGSIEE